METPSDPQIESPPEIFLAVNKLIKSRNDAVDHISTQDKLLNEIVEEEKKLAQKKATVMEERVKWHRKKEEIEKQAETARTVLAQIKS